MIKIKNPICKGQDPFIIKVKDKYYQYTQSSDDMGYDVLISKDLQTWENAGRCLYKDDCIGNKNFWAPEIIQYQNKYVMVFTANFHIGIAFSDKPEGPFKQIEKKWIFEKEAIDGHLFIDNDKLYLYNVFWGVNEKNEPREEIWGCELSGDFSPKTETLVCLILPIHDWESIEGNVVEGPYMLKRNGKYYLTYSANNWTCDNYSVGYAVSNSPLGEFVKYKNNPILQSGENYVSPGHNSFFKDNDELICAYHIHKSKTEPAPRQVCVSKAYFIQNKDEEILFIEKPL